MKSLVEILCTRAADLPERDAYTFLVDGETDAVKLTYRELDQRARAVAAQLEMVCEPRARALLLFPPGLDYIAAFCGCLYAGVVAVPAYPPRMNRNLQRLQAIVADSDAAVALTTTATLARIKPSLAQQEGLENLRWLETDNLANDLAATSRMPDINRETLALLQYTSGSTATPKGVMVTHGNLLHNESMIQRAFRQTPDSIIAGWLPLYHDMGLIGTVLQPLFTGSRCVLMSHVAFLQRPVRWLEAISLYRATTSGAPNFGYELCTRKVTAEERESLDLSTWSTAFNGSEPVRADTLEQFSKTFAPCGFRASAFYPCYGLAEATLFVSGSPEPRVPHVKAFAAEALERNRVIETDDAEARRLVSCGDTAPDQRVVIVNHETRSVCGANEVGEIWVAGDSVTSGYWKRPEETAETFGARTAEGGESFLRTGDLGFIHDDELFITGRLKDLIIIRGRNLYPHDIERTVQESHPKLRSAVGAAFSITNGEERLVVVHEAERSAKCNHEEILSAIRAAVAEEYEVQLNAVVIVKTGGVPRTSSGKIQRRACREMFLSNQLDILAGWRESSTNQREKKSMAVVIRPGQSLAEVETWLCTQLAQKLGVDVSDIDVEKPITHYGIDSVATVELMHALETGLGVVIPFTSFYRSPNIREIARETTNLVGRHDDHRIHRLPRITTAIPRS